MSRWAAPDEHCGLMINDGATCVMDWWDCGLLFFSNLVLVSEEINIVQRAQSMVYTVYNFLSQSRSFLKAHCRIPEVPSSICFDVLLAYIVLWCSLAIYKHAACYLLKRLTDIYIYNSIYIIYRTIMYIMSCCAVFQAVSIGIPFGCWKVLHQVRPMSPMLETPGWLLGASL